MAAERATVVIYDDKPEAWKYPVDVAEKLGLERSRRRSNDRTDNPKDIRTLSTQSFAFR